MKEKEEFYKIEGLIRKESLDKIYEELNPKHEPYFKSKSSIVFDAIKNNGLEVLEIILHEASARKDPEHITLDVSGNGESTMKKDWKRY